MNDYQSIVNLLQVYNSSIKKELLKEQVKNY